MTQMPTGPGAEAPRLVGGDHPTWLPDEILPGLFMGGTRDDDIVSRAARLAGLDDAGPGYDAVVTLYAWAQPMPWEVEELRYGFGDGALDEAHIGRLLRTAEWAHRRWAEGDRVLIRCQAGLNRSGLITALVLMMDGRTAEEAIDLVQSRRSRYALYNMAFVLWLRTRAPQLISDRLSDRT